MEALISGKKVLLMQCLLFASQVFGVAISPPSDNLQLANKPQQFRNLSDVENPRFRYTINFYRSIQLPIIDVLMNGLDALSVFASKNYTERSSNMHFHSSDYPAVTIDVEPTAPAEDYSNEIAVLCLYHLMADSVTRRFFKQAQVSCVWDNVEVATIWVKKYTPNVPSVPSTVATANPVSAAVQPRFSYLVDAEGNAIIVVFVTVMDAMKWFAKYSDTAIVPRCYTSPGPGWNSGIFFPGTQAPRTEPPYLEYRWVIESLKRVPAFMLQNGRSAELTIDFRVDDTALGSALLSRKTPVQAAAVRFDPNVATA
ncbi:MAG: hypothetical protein Q9222_005660 [Ikaeria aurantiellina]